MKYLNIALAVSNETVHEQSALCSTHAKRK